MFEGRDFSLEANKYKDAKLCIPKLDISENYAIGSYSHLNFKDLVEEFDDMRRLIPELANHHDKISPSEVVIDSDMPLHQAFRALSPDCPAEILAQQDLIRVFYFGFDGNLHQGQVVIHQELTSDVIDLFSMMLEKKLKIGSVVPVADQRFERDGKWDDIASMEANNSSAFNYRRIITPSGEKKTLSLHALGMALDINPVHNPCFGNPKIHCTESFQAEAAAGYKEFIPQNAKYDLTSEASLHNRHPITLFLLERGWTWGGNWGDPKDLHHFQKIPDGWSDYVKDLRSRA